MSDDIPPSPTVLAKQGAAGEIALTCDGCEWEAEVKPPARHFRSLRRRRVTRDDRVTQLVAFIVGKSHLRSCPAAAR